MFSLRGLIALLLLPSAISAAAIPQAVEQALEMVKADLDGFVLLQFNRTTRSGQFSGCELQYKATFRDYRARGGEVVLLIGAISSLYEKGKVFNLGLKVKAAELEIATPLIQKPFQPGYASLSFRSPLDRFKSVEFICDGGGICVGYSDNSRFDLMKEVMETVLLPGPTITVATTKGGTDQRLSLSKLIHKNKQNSDKNKDALIDFQGCLTEVLESMMKDVRANN
ncbi:MAG: hypothetical protein ACM3SS_19610 [Rhodospirillaceae bacterium]